MTISSRHCIPWLFASWCLFAVATAQESSGTSGGGSGSGASSSFGSGSESPTGGSSGPSTGGSSIFGSAPAGTTPSATPPGGTTTGGSTTGGSTLGGPASTPDATGSADTGGGEKPRESAPASYSISTGYGRPPEVYVAGVGRLAKPRFEIKLNGSIGFDDNIFQTPTHAREVPEQVIRVQTTAGTEDQIILVPVPVRQGPTPIGSPIRPAPASPRFNTVFVPGTDPQFEEIVIPGLPKPKRKASAISRASLGVQVQTATRRSVFTLDLNVNEDYYWNRPKQKEEHNGGLAVLFLHRFTPRLQVTAAVNAAYLSQPDLSQINTPTRTGAGSYLNLTSKFDLAYRWAPRFSTVSSLSYNQLSFEEKLRQTGNYQAYLLGTELRYLWSPRLTAVVEGRYGATWYPENPSLDSVSYFALIGLDIAVSRRAGATLRLGGSTRVFDETGKKSTAPYLETTLNYALGRASVLRLNGRFGFEEPPDPNTEVLSFRTGVNVTHFFTPRLSTALAINAIHRTSTNDIADIETTEDTLDTTLALEYTLSRHWSFNLNYSYTTVFDDPGNSDYFRNRLFTGFDYEF